MTDRDWTVAIDAQGRFRIAGKPFFPIGLYSVPHEESFGELRRAGFNTVHSYEFERTLYLNLQSRTRTPMDFDGLGDDAALRYMDAADENGLMVLMGFNRPKGVSRDVFSDEGRQQMRRRVCSLRQHPALLAWYLYDEPDGQGEPAAEVEENRRIVASLDPAHPTMTVLVCPDKFAEYAQSADVLMCDDYPVPKEPLCTVARKLTELKGIAGPERATVGVLQAFDWRSYDWTNTDTRPPTVQELRCMTYQAIASNVSAIFYFNYYNELSSNRSSDNPRGWAALMSVANELERLMPALLAPPCERTSFKGDVVATYRKVGNETWILAANTGPASCHADFPLPDGASKAIVRSCFGTGSHLTADGSLPVDIEPYGVRALRIQCHSCIKGQEG